MKASFYAWLTVAAAAAEKHSVRSRLASHACV